MDDITDQSLIIVVRVSVVELLRKRAIKIITTTIPPTTHAHGCIYQVVVSLVVVVVTLLLELVLSWAILII